MPTIGTCSKCNGPVQVPDLWGGTVPPVPTCAHCGATAKDPYGPIMVTMRPIPMEKRSPSRTDAVGTGEGWRLNRINAGPPFRVETIKYGPQYTHARESLPQVCDDRGVVALSGPGGAVFCATHEQAEQLCELANAGMLERT